ncbi:LytTR family transcriptional regulator DNA-binding domain-containing protein [Anaerocolumna sp. MB42-C2]|uniref:LytTR family transcriptional regulator DNA-binding domain-containing protein n=1 Tax=Anaerocolumna sp. MB42-C2 TaxID=3070997 RepID=UPI0027DF3BCA|nr:LytTR family transcriptional regulator DNA-binding domain-containing protein [Anaerocolumna sp. MB42-C2]WMJ88517.1 LytTR family transcriptional regulator DNA-binding domain-containing protein [Anaerocolumna sp. MB42-C2]
MLINLEKNVNLKDIEVLIKYASMNPTLNRLITLLKSMNRELKCISNENNQIWISVLDIYYVESVDKKTYVYCDKAVYRSSFSIYKLQHIPLPVLFSRFHRFSLVPAFP